MIQPCIAYTVHYYIRYQGNTAEALQQLNHARRDSVWGLRALTHMVHICLNPNDDVIGGEVFRGTTEKEGRLEHTPPLTQ